MSDLDSSRANAEIPAGRGSARTAGANAGANAGTEPLGATESADTAASVSISLIIPALNEAVRLPPCLEAIRAYMDTRYPSDYQLIVVDDGSTDQMPAVLDTIARGWPQLTMLRHASNRGKGAAVRTGFAAATGTRLLFADADGATPIEEEAKLRAVIDGGADMAVGSRLIADADVVRRRTWTRALIGRLFAAVARCVVAVPVRDTQCGFKMFRASAGKKLLVLAREDGYLFDIELLGLARQMRFKVVEIPINWADQPGSQLNLGRLAFRVLPDLWRIRRRLRALRHGDVANRG